MASSKWIVYVLTCTFLCNASSEEITVTSGDDVTLQCQGPRDADIDTVIKWIRPDLKSEGFVFYFRDNRIYEDFQHESFRGRVEPMNQKMKNGNFSVILKNVNISDAGTYECYVGNKGNRPQLISTITLTVRDSGGAAGHKDEEHKDGGNKGVNVGLVVSLSVFAAAAAAAVGFLIYKKCKRVSEPNLSQPPVIETAETSV